MMMEKQGKMETDGIVMIHVTSASVTMEGFGKMKWHVPQVDIYLISHGG